jgi:hypothetical protein
MEKTSERKRAKEGPRILGGALTQTVFVWHLVASDQANFSFFLVRGDAKAFFSPLRLGRQRIPTRAPVKSSRRLFPEGTRSRAERSLQA